jgi:hypothetical protein
VYAFQTPIGLKQARQKSEKTGQTILFYEKSLRMRVEDQWQFWAARTGVASIDAYIADPKDLDQILALGLVLVGRAKERLDNGEALEAGDCVTLELKFAKF